MKDEKLNFQTAIVQEDFRKSSILEYLSSNINIIDNLKSLKNDKALQNERIVFSAFFINHL